MNGQDPREFLTLAEFALKLGLSKETVMKLIKRRIIRAIQFGEHGKWLVHRTEIARLAEAYRR